MKVFGLVWLGIRTTLWWCWLMIHVCGFLLLAFVLVIAGDYLGVSRVHHPSTMEAVAFWVFLVSGVLSARFWFSDRKIPFIPFDEPDAAAASQPEPRCNAEPGPSAKFVVFALVVARLWSRR